MLEWLTGSSRYAVPRVFHSGTSSGDSVPGAEPPATPAPLFAVRAFRTAIFGATPEPQTQEPDVRTESEAKTQTAAQPATKPNSATASSNGNGNERAERKLSALPHDVFASPAKPAGILLTPGTGPSRRKRVSFEALVVDKEEIAVSQPKTSEDEHTSSGATLWARSPADSTSASAPTSLTKALYHAKLQGAKASEGGLKGSRKDQFEDEPLASHSCTCSHCHWKLELESYKERTNHVMKKLLKYKHDAKRYGIEMGAEAEYYKALLQAEKDKTMQLQAELSELAHRTSRLQASDRYKLDAQLGQASAEPNALRKESEPLWKERQGSPIRRGPSKEKLLMDEPKDVATAFDDSGASSQIGGARASRLPSRTTPSRLKAGPRQSSREMLAPISPLAERNINAAVDTKLAQEAAPKSLFIENWAAGVDYNSHDPDSLPAAEAFQPPVPSPERMIMVASNDDPVARLGSNRSPTRPQTLRSYPANTTDEQDIYPEGRRSVGRKVRQSLPPDRAAAAKARLERKRAESRRKQGSGDTSALSLR